MHIYYCGQKITSEEFRQEMGREPVDEKDIRKVASWLLEVREIEMFYDGFMTKRRARNYYKRRAGHGSDCYPEELRLRNEASSQSGTIPEGVRHQPELQGGAA